MAILDLGKVQGYDGKDGITYTPTIGKINTVDNSTLASASVDIDEDKKIAKFNFNIPKGKDGEDGSGSEITVDTTMSDTSENAVQNKVIKEYVDNKIAKENIYSTREETIIGQWVDGKPIYQKTITDVAPQVDVDGTATSSARDISSLNIKQVIAINGILTDNVGMAMDINSRIGDLTYTGAYVNDGKTLIVYSNNRNFNSRTVYVTLQYTKTTD